MPSTAERILPELDPSPVRCPDCGDHHVHLENVAVHQDRRLHVVERAGVIESEIPTSSGRGSAVEVRFVCESGHLFALRFHFHKGVTSYEVIDRGECAAGVIPSELWRD